MGDVISLLPTSKSAYAVAPFVFDRVSRRHPHRVASISIESTAPLPSNPAADDLLPLYSDLRLSESKSPPSTHIIRRSYRRRFFPAFRRLLLWRAVYRDLFSRVYYRRWGLYTLRRRLSTQLRRKVRPFARPVPPILPFLRSATPLTARRTIPSLSTSGGRLVNQSRSGGFFDNAEATDFSVPNSGLSDSFYYLLKASLSLRLRASLLPRVVLSAPRSSGVFHRPFLRSRRRRYLRSRRFKSLRRRKISRLRPVHRYTPSYLQRDFRTLRAIRVHAPTTESVVFPFRGSLAQVEAFYRSRAF